MTEHAEVQNDNRSFCQEWFLSGFLDEKTPSGNKMQQQLRDLGPFVMD